MHYWRSSNDRPYMYRMGIVCVRVHCQMERGVITVMWVYFVTMGVLFIVGIVEVIKGWRECNEADI